MLHSLDGMPNYLNSKVESYMDLQKRKARRRSCTLLTTTTITVSEVTHLDHKVLHDPMDGRVFVMKHRLQKHRVKQSRRDSFIVQFSKAQTNGQEVVKQRQENKEGRHVSNDPLFF